MNLGEIFKWCQAKIPEADSNVIPSISTTQLCIRDIVNEGAKEFVRLTRCLPKDKKINCTTGTQTYSLTSNIPDFSEMRESGVWHLRSNSSLTWDRLEPITERELDEKFRTWRDQSNNDQIRYYWRDGDMLGLFYTPSTTLSNGLRVYYYANASDMTTASTYPFVGTTTEEPRLAPYSNLLVDYYEAKALDILGYKADASAKLQTYYTKVAAAKNELNSQRDIAQSSVAKPKTQLNAMRNIFRR